MRLGDDRSPAWMVAVATFMTLSTLARAQDEAGLAQSNELFERAKRSQASGEVAAACDLFTQSYALAPRGGTLLNLGLCHEAIGRLLVARSELTAAREYARRDQRMDREAILAQHIAAIEAKLAWLTVLPPPNVAPDLLELRLDGSIVDAHSPGGIPVEAGEHELSAVADGFREQSTRVAAAEGAKLTVRLEPLANREAQAALPSIEHPEPIAPAAVTRAETISTTDVSGHVWAPIRTGALVVGLLGISTSLVMGGLAFAAAHTVSEHCRDRHCDPVGAAAAKRGAAVETAADVSAIVGGVGLATWVVVPGGWLNPERPRGTAFGVSVRGRL